MSLQSSLPRWLNPGNIIAGTALIAAPLSLINGLAMAPLLALSSLSLLLLNGRGTWQGALLRPQWLLLAALLLWSALSLLWTVAPLETGLRTLASNIGTMLGGAALLAATGKLEESERNRLTQALSIGLAIALPILLVTCVVGRAALPGIPDQPDSLRWYYFATARDRGVTVIGLLIWPAIAGLVRQGKTRAAWILALAAIPPLFLSFATAAKLAYLVGIAAFLLSRWQPRFIVMTAGTLIAIFTVLVPVAANLIPPPAALEGITQHVPASVHHRLVIWNFVGGKILQRPLAGFGLEASRMLGEKQAIVITDPSGYKLEAELLPLHPHDAAMQIWLELGSVGALIFTIFLGTITRRLRDLTAPRSALACAIAASGACFVFLAVSFGVWQSWWLCTLWMIAAFSAAQLKPKA